MAGTIALIGIFVAIAVGLWLTRNAKGPRPGEAAEQAGRALSRYDVMGEPIAQPDDELDPPG